MKIVAVICVLIMCMGLFATCTPSGRRIATRYQHDMTKAVEDNTYTNRKMVEDTVRSMMASYKADKETWIMYKDSDIEEERSWSKQARMRANRTASNYNEFITKNVYVFKGNIPEDVQIKLSYVE